MLNNGDQLTVTSQQNGWAQIQYNGTSAWVSSDYLTIRESVTKVDESELQTVTIRDDSTNIRNKPSRDGAVIEKQILAKGSLFREYKVTGIKYVRQAAKKVM